MIDVFMLYIQLQFCYVPNPKNEKNVKDLSGSNGYSLAIQNHTDGSGRPLTPQQVRFAMKLQKENENKEEEFESIARTLGIDVEQLADEILAAESP